MAVIPIGSGKFTLQAGLSKPFTIEFLPRNEGAVDTSYWGVNAIFCNGVRVSNYDENWTPSPRDFSQVGFVYPNMLYFQSTRPLLREQASFNGQVDSIGQFQIAFPLPKDNLKIPASIPLVFVQTWGQKTNPVGELVSLQIDSIASSSIEYSSNDIKILRSAVINSGCMEVNTATTTRSQSVW